MLNISRNLYDQSERLATAHVQYYTPLPISGVYARPSHWRMIVEKGVATPFNPYGVSPNGFTGADFAVATGAPLVAQAAAAAAAAAAAVTAVATPSASTDAGAETTKAQPVPTVQSAQSVQSAQQQAQRALPGQPLTQQIYIPNDMVGAIIGKGGSKINEIRQLSGSSIKINEAQDNSNERLVTITGTTECNRMLILYCFILIG